MTDGEETTAVNEVSLVAETETKLVLDAKAPKPRLCHLRKWPNFQGYGFNLHAERSKMGQHIGKVDPDSPAESAGLREGDRIIEVNFVNISNENHQQVVKRIRTGLDAEGLQRPDEVVLLVVDREADEYYKNLSIIVKHDFENVLKLSTALPAQEEAAETVNEASTSDNNSTSTSNNNINNNNNDKLNRTHSSNSKSSTTKSVSSSNELDSNNNNHFNSVNSGSTKIENETVKVSCIV
jgi:Na(+)/H(+) exchange regulatory cofactor NHE-RF2